MINEWRTVLFVSKYNDKRQKNNRNFSAFIYLSAKINCDILDSQKSPKIQNREIEVCFDAIE